MEQGPGQVITTAAGRYRIFQCRTRGHGEHWVVAKMHPTDGYYNAVYAEGKTREEAEGWLNSQSQQGK